MNVSVSVICHKPGSMVPPEAVAHDFVAHEIDEVIRRAEDYLLMHGFGQWAKVYIEGKKAMTLTRDGAVEWS